MDGFSLKRFEEPRRYHVRFYDNKEIYETFRGIDAARMFISSKSFVKSWLEIYDSKTDRVIFEFVGEGNVKTER